MGFLAVLLSLESHHPALVWGCCLARAGSPRPQQAGISKPCQMSPACLHGPRFPLGDERGERDVFWSSELKCI